jgi:hypothetical protein
VALDWERIRGSAVRQPSRLLAIALILGPHLLVMAGLVGLEMMKRLDPDGKFPTDLLELVLAGYLLAGPFCSMGGMHWYRGGILSTRAIVASAVLGIIAFAALGAAGLSVLIALASLW